MRDWIEAKVASTKLDHLSFFRSAFFWNFQKMYEPRTDVMKYKEQGIIPLYVANYVRFLQALEGKRNEKRPRLP